MRQYIDSDDLAGEVRMGRSLDPRTVLIVEGATDARFFERFVDHEHCYVLAAHDRERAVAVLRVLNSVPLSGILAIVDADFRRLTGTLEPDRSLLYCDGHDLEIMVLQSQALDRVVTEHCSQEKLNAFLSKLKQPMVLASVLARSCVPIGALILVSLTEDIGLTFENLSFRDFIESDTLEVDFVKLIRAVMNKSSKHDPVLAERLHQLVLSVLNQTPDIWETSRGHDCVELLSLALHSTIGTKKSRTEDRRTTQVNSDLLERELRLTFSETDFSHTLLHQAINNWESANPGRRVVLPT